ncbi:MAG: hypothetical protein EOP22_14345 [Hyphomicrobiales bacterium]|nr:MAG: hypothetical protein EOP22_14345 [Hyphomicrobiales bacterium]
MLEDMPQFFFHVRQRNTVFEDTRGGDFPDLKVACDWAVEDARVMVRECQLSGPPEQCWVEICDPTDTTVATVPFVRVVH